MDAFKFTSNKLRFMLQELYEEFNLYDIKYNIFSSHIPEKFIKKKLIYWNSLEEFTESFKIGLYKMVRTDNMTNWLINTFPIEKYTSEVIDNFINCICTDISQKKWIEHIVKLIEENSCSNELIWITIFRVLQMGYKWKSPFIQNLFHNVKYIPIKNKYILNIHFQYLRYNHYTNIYETYQRHEYVNYYKDCKHLISKKCWDITSHLMNFNPNFFPDIEDNVYLDAMYSIKQHVIMTKMNMSRSELIHIKYKRKWEKVHVLFSNLIKKKYFIRLYKHKLKYHVVMNELSLIPSKVYKSIPKGGEKYFNLFNKYKT